MSDSGKSLIICGTINEIECTITCDTGASITVINFKLFEKIKAKHGNFLGEKVMLRNASSTNNDLEGFMLPSTTLNLGGDDLVWDVVVADIQDECLLGLDLLSSYGSVIDLGKMKLHMKEKEQSIVKLKSTVKLEPNTINYVEAKLVPPLPANHYIAVEPMPRSKLGKHGKKSI